MVELITRLPRDRYEPHVLCLHGARTGVSRHFGPDLERAGVPVTDLDLRWTPEEAAVGILRIIRCVWRLRPALVHSVNHHANHLTRLARPFLPLRTRLITAVRTDYTRRQLFYERCEQRLAHRIVCNSPHMERKLRERAGVPNPKLVCIPNGIDVARFAANPDPGLRARLAPGARRLAVMMARITEQKSPHLLAHALATLKARGALDPTTQVWVVGERDSRSVQQQLDAAIESGKLTGTLFQHPPTEAPEAFYHAADFTILASLWEGLPNAVLESFAAGRPALVSEAANASGLVEDGVTGWVVRTGDVAHLAERLAEILALPDAAWIVLQAACRRRAGDFSMEAMVRRYEALYDETLAKFDL